MSVQAGIWNLYGEPVKREFLARLSSTIAEYGPDGENTYLDSAVGMLFRSFYTTPESRLEVQPYISSAGNVITWDGRLDNRDELICLLHSDRAADRTDVAIVGSAIDRWGTDCFAKLVGDWALCIWKHREKDLILARDYMGIRHLFYYLKPERVLWCSHLASLALCGDQFTLCDQYIAGYLTSHPEAHLTPYREIHSVSPGNFVRIHDAKATIHNYWAFNPRHKIYYKRDADYEEHYRHLFRQAVRRRLRTESPTLSELSGGLDSSSIVCMADDILAKEGAETPQVDTFSYYDSNEPGEDDLPHLTKVEEKRRRRGLRVDLKGSGDSLPLEVTAFVVTPGFGSRAELKAVLSNIDQQRKYRVVLCGTGGDEVNGQPLDPRVQMADLLAQLRVAEMVKQLFAWALLMRSPLVQLLYEVMIQFLPVSLRAHLTNTGKLERWVDHKFAQTYSFGARQLDVVEGSWFLRPGSRDAVQTILTLNRRMTYVLPRVMEQRYPYLDQTLVEFLTSIPLDQLLRPGQRRSLMRRALRDLLPPEVLSRKTKTSAAHCYPVALEKHWNKVESLFSSPLTARLGYVNADRIRAALLRMKSGQVPIFVLRLLKALSLEVWLREAEARRIILI